jgi:CRP-like cAMP-binding protein
MMRNRAVGLTQDHSCDLPLTQDELGDAVGVSTVHVNRVLQDLRRDGLIVLRNGRLSTPDWEGLQEAGEFDPVYLHIEREEARA